ncbi:SNF2-related protein [Candidatus Magnetominusculus dajiuhuensis]|uniref:SNF2-related protein n=1 Tax=Candidatus Magnetominusculus dajiuhuensis TaxID=3137712 RepID=UPI003B4377F7
MTAFHSAYFAYELTKRHSVNDSEKLATVLADAQVDLNPHQLDAALFAFKSPLSKGSILADEVGLGKTIEAGLVIAQKWSEGKRRIIIITPANLRKQWAQEMADKFYLPAAIMEAKNYRQIKLDGISNPFIQDSLVICSYQFAAKYADVIVAMQWDMAVIDEAHRLRNVYKTDNKIAKAIKNALVNTPKILLTATPLQNTLLELYGLVSVIDDYAFGDLRSYKTMYARLIGDAVFDELKSRLAPLCHRTLRRQVLEYIRYTNRIPITEDFFPSDDETALYEMVSEYLRKPLIHALPNSQRQLITLIMRKLLASSTFAIAGALDSLAQRLRRELKGVKVEPAVDDIAQDYEEYSNDAEEWDEGQVKEGLSPADIASIEKEIEGLETFRDIAVSITENAKGHALLNALTHGFIKAKELGAAEKTIIFTESRRTQSYLVRLLSENGYAGKIVLFNGTNNDQQSRTIYKEWRIANKNTDRISASKSADMRAALVDYFKDHAQIMIATEAGAEGINLQFCSMVVNFDLPWNPQRIEQRIGRCHRYGQQYDVVVINFINRKNAADQRVYKILAEKFKLFSGLFGASDEVLGAIDSGIDFEKRVAAIYQNCRTSEEIEAEFLSLQSEMETNITATMADTRKKLIENFDAEVHDRLRLTLAESREYLNKYDTMLWRLTRNELKDSAQFDDETLSFTLKTTANPGKNIPSGTYTLARQVDSAHRYRIGHPLAQSLIASARGRPLPAAMLEFDYTGWQLKAAALEVFVGQKGLLTLSHLAITGADAHDHLILCAMTDDGVFVPDQAAKRLFELPCKEIPSKINITDTKNLEDEVRRRKNAAISDIAAKHSRWFDDEIYKLNNWAEDKRRGLKAELKDYNDQIKNLKREARLAPSMPEKMALQRKMRDIDAKRGAAWKDYDEAAKLIEQQKDGLLDTVEQRLKHTIEEKTIFTIQWRLT